MDKPWEFIIKQGSLDLSVFKEKKVEGGYVSIAGEHEVCSRNVRMRGSSP